MQARRRPARSTSPPTRRRPRPAAMTKDTFSSCWRFRGLTAAAEKTAGRSAAKQRRYFSVSSPRWLRKAEPPLLYAGKKEGRPEPPVVIVKPPQASRPQVGVPLALLQARDLGDARGHEGRFGYELV